ncbi:Probable alpha-mannosidase At5g13980 [Linum perenne]
MEMIGAEYQSSLDMIQLKPERWLFTTAAAGVMFMMVLLIPSGESKYMVYNTSQGMVADKLNIHLVPHTHNDVGWLKTVDQYYVGANNSIQAACVQNILDSLIPALLADENRKFIYVEIAFFERWWNDQSEAMKHIVKKLVASGQLEFINGGMCMHDEATTHYIDMIDQTTLGHRFLEREFGVTPRIGWQIDPFGHSAVQAYLLGAEVGFDSVFFARIDYQDREKRKGEKSLEMVWQGSKSLPSSQIFTGAFPTNYDPPPGGFYLEINDISPIVQDDTGLSDYNLPERVNAFVAAAISQANITRTNHIMFTMGTDFQYQYATTWFRPMDKLIHYLNLVIFAQDVGLDGRVNAFYSTPSIYTDAKHSANETWPLKAEDFFPYADRANAFWTGYFTSRPALKRYVRVMSGYYLAARQLEFFKGRSSLGPNTDSLADAMAIAQHHDAVTGTEKQHVANDYAKRLATGYAETEKVVSASLSCLYEIKSHAGCRSQTTNFKQCPLLNISYCPASENINIGKKLIVLVYNSLGWSRDEVIQIPVTSDDVLVHDPEGKEVEAQLIPLVDAYIRLRNFHVRAYLGTTPAGTPKYWLAFRVSVPPFGFSIYTVSSANTAGAPSTKPSVYKSEISQKSVAEVGQGDLKLNCSASQGKTTSYTNDRSLVKERVYQSYSYYGGYNGTKEKSPQNSGAYIFRPNGTYRIEHEHQVPLTVIRGPVVEEIHEEINEWIYQIGPIPIDDGVGKEVVTQITTSLKTSKTFYTDSNGRDFIKRIRDYRTDWDLEVTEPVAGNYYPINLGIYVEDDKQELSVLVDRALGGTSIKDGQIELLLHRRLLLDDSRDSGGLDEALNETVCAHDKCTGLTIQGKYYYRIDPIGEGAKWRRSFAQQIYSPLLLAFAEEETDEPTNSHVTTFSGLAASYTLPDNVAVVTLQELDDGKVLLRLAHLYEVIPRSLLFYGNMDNRFDLIMDFIKQVGEDKDLSVKTTVELTKLFPGKKIGKVVEMSLSANQERTEMEKKRLVWKSESAAEEKVARRGRPVDKKKLEVELYPMEIRTFLIDIVTVKD